MVSLGILQALASLKLLTRVNYLSTVSGGGYVGGWLAAWVRREADGAAYHGRDGTFGVRNTQTQMDPNRLAQSASIRDPLTESAVVDEEPEPVHHLRRYSRYLTPRPGLLQLDSWAIIGIYTRNVVVNLMLMLPLAMLAVLFVRLLVYPFTPVAGMPCRWLAVADMVVVFASFISAYAIYYRQLVKVRMQATRRTAHERDRGYRFASLGFLFLAAYLSIYLFGGNPTGEDARISGRVVRVRRRYPVAHEACSGRSRHDLGDIPDLGGGRRDLVSRLPDVPLEVERPEYGGSWLGRPGGRERRPGPRTGRASGRRVRARFISPGDRQGRTGRGCEPVLPRCPVPILGGPDRCDWCRIDRCRGRGDCREGQHVLLARPVPEPSDPVLPGRVAADDRVGPVRPGFPPPAREPTVESVGAPTGAIPPVRRRTGSRTSTRTTTSRSGT